MPYRKRRSYKKKRRGRKRRSRFSKRNTIVSMRNPIANRALVKMRYCTTVSINPGAAAAAANVFSANGLFDPDITSGANHAPLGLDQWMTFYQKFTVIGSKISATFSPRTATISSGSSICGIALRNTSTVETNGELVREQGNTRWFQLGAGNSQNPRTMSYKFSPKKWFGVKSILGEPDYAGTTAANPTKQAYFHVWLAPPDDATDLDTMYVNVVIEYLAMLTEPITLAQS